jgi:hypothetical protein
VIETGIGINCRVRKHHEKSTKAVRHMTDTKAKDFKALLIWTWLALDR